MEHTSSSAGGRGSRTLELTLGTATGTAVLSLEGPAASGSALPPAFPGGHEGPGFCCPLPGRPDPLGRQGPWPPPCRPYCREASRLAGGKLEVLFPKTESGGFQSEALQVTRGACGQTRSLESKH